MHLLFFCYPLISPNLEALLANSDIGYSWKMSEVLIVNVNVLIFLFSDILTFSSLLVFIFSSMENWIYKFYFNEFLRNSGNSP